MAARASLSGLAALLLLSLAPAHTTEGPALRLGLRLEEPMRVGDSRAYPVDLAAGQFLRVAVTEEGIDVELRLVAPDRRTVAFVDGPTFPKEDEDLAAVAPRAGRYRLEIHGGGGRAGRYRLRVVGLRAAGDRDRRRAEAVRLTQQADVQMFDKYEQGWRRQLATRERTVELWRGLDDGRRLGIALFRIGELHINLGEIASASQALHQADGALRAAGDPAGLAAALDETMLADRKLFRSAEAVEHFKEAQPLARAGGDLTLQANLLENLGQAYGDLGRPREALHAIEKAREIARRAGDPGGEARSLLALGYAHADLEERQKALGCYREALEIAQRAGLREEEAVARINLGDTHEVLGQWDDAAEEDHRALRLFQGLGEPLHEAQSLNHLYLVESHSGRYAEAAQDLQRAVELGRRFGNPAIESTSRANLARLDLDRGENRRALAEAETATRVAPAGDQAEIDAWIALGAARRVGKDLRGATAALARGNVASEAEADLLLAMTARDARELDRAAAWVRAAIEILESLRTRVGSAELRTSYLASVRWFYELAVDISMALERERPGEGYAARALTFAEQARARSLLALLTAAGAKPRRHADPALALREQRARAAVSAVDLRRLELLRGNPPPSAAAIAAAGRAVDAARAAYQRIESELADRSPSYASLTEPQPLSAEAIERQVLDPQTLLLELALGERRSFLWVVSSRGLASFELPKRAAIETAARRYYELATARNRSPPGETLARRQARLDRSAGELPGAATALSRMILGPAAALLGRCRLVVVADGLLQYVPFPALPDPAGYAAPLVDAHEIVVLPSASALAVQRRELAGRRPARGTLAVLADPVFSRDDPRLHAGSPPILGGATSPRRAAPAGSGGPLPAARGGAGEDCGGETSFSPLHFSRQEAASILQLVPAADRFVATGFAASRDTVLSGRLAGYRLIHFATHGCIDSLHPDLSSLVLSLVDSNGRSEDGFLRLADIYQLDLHADLVVLSACRTALGKQVEGEGLIGLTRGFMHAGAARVLASLWSVDDRATARLMERFYRGLLIGKLTPAAALRAAQRDMARDPSFGSPYYWAGFSLEGEWR